MKTAKATAAAVDDDYDSISINSTDHGEEDDDERYNVDCILSERSEYGEMFYLIKWENYDYDACTWEPEQNIEDITLQDWQDDKRRIERGEKEPFDVNAWEIRDQQLRQAREDRRRRRVAKRKRLGFRQSSERLFQRTSMVYSDSSDEAVEVYDEPADVPSHPGVRQRQRLPPQKELRQFVIDHGDDGMSEKGVTPRFGSPHDNEDDAETANLSEDSLIRDLNAKAAKRSQKVLEGNNRKQIAKTRSKKVSGRQQSPSTSVSSRQKLRNDDSLIPPPRATASVPSVKPRTEAPSRTGYQGTANRASTIRLSSQNVPGDTLSRDSMRDRGGRAIRGGRLGYRPNFAGPTKATEGRTLTKRLLDGDKQNEKHNQKHNELFKTFSAMRKAELAGRAAADRAPDPGSLKLINPSEYRSFGRIPKKSKSDRATKASTSTVTSAKSSYKSSITFADEKLSSLIDKPDEFDHRDDDKSDGDIGMKRVDMDNQKHILIQPASARVPDYTPLHEGLQNTTADPQPTSIDEIATSSATIAKKTTKGNITTPLMDSDAMTAHQTSLEANDTASETNKRVVPSNFLTKMKFNDYKSRQAVNPLNGKLIVTAVFGIAPSQSLSIGFTDMDQDSHQPLIQELRNRVDIKFDAICLSKDFKVQKAALTRQTLASGSIITDSAGMSLINQVAETLRPMFGLASTHENFLIMVFPTRCDDWDFLEVPATAGTDVLLRYSVFERNFPVDDLAHLPTNESSISSIDLKRDYLDSIVGLYQGLSCRNLVSALNVNAEASDFFLLFPQKSAATACFFENWLHASDPRNKVFTNQKSGSWRSFTSRSTVDICVILIHETLVPKIFKIPGLLKLLIGTGNKFNFWCVSDGSFATPLFRPMDGEGSAFPVGKTTTRLFPFGGAIFLTPSFLVSEPENTYELLTFINQKVEKSTPGTWKLVACHNLRQYLFDLALRAADESEELYASFPPDKQDKHDVAAKLGLSHRACETRFLNHSLLDSIMTKERMTGFPNSWDEDEPDEFECPIIYADRSIGQNDERQLVEWFSGWTMTRLNLFRKFVVVGTKSREFSLNSHPKEKVDASTEVAAQNPIISKLQVKGKMGTENQSSGNLTVKTALSTSLSKPAVFPTANKAVELMKVSKPVDTLTPRETKEPALLNGSGVRPADSTSSLYLNRIPSFVNELALLNMFQGYGPILSTRVVSSKASWGRLDGYINFEYVNSAINAKYKMSDQQLFRDEGPQKINFAVPRSRTGLQALNQYIPPAAEKDEEVSIPISKLLSKPSPLIGPEHWPSGATSSIWLGSIPGQTTQDELEEIFQCFGPILSTRVVNRSMGRGCDGFINFKYTNSAVNVKILFRDEELVFASDGVNINFAKAQGYRSPPGSPIGRDNTIDAIVASTAPATVAEHGSSHNRSHLLQPLLNDSVRLNHLLKQKANSGGYKIDGPTTMDNDAPIDMSGDESTTIYKQPSRPNHGIDQYLNENLLNFIVYTGSNPATAELYLKKFNGNYNEALHHFSQDQQRSFGQVVSESEGAIKSQDAATLLQFIGGTETEPQSKGLLRQAHEDARRAAELYRSDLGLYDGSSPSSMDGADDRHSGERKRSSKSGIFTDPETSQRFVPISKRPNGSTRPQINIRSGFIPPEDRVVYQRPRVTRSDFGDNDSPNEYSRNGSLSKSNESVSKDASRDETKKSVPEKPSFRKGTFLGVSFEEATVDWYEKIRQEGNGWAHILVCDSSSASKVLGIKPK